MAQSPGDGARVSTFDQRVNDAQMISSPPDDSTTPEALVVLLRDGVEAHRRYVAEQRQAVSD